MRGKSNRFFVSAMNGRGDSGVGGRLIQFVISRVGAQSSASFTFVSAFPDASSN